MIICCIDCGKEPRRTWREEHPTCVWSSKATVPHYPQLFPHVMMSSSDLQCCSTEDQLLPARPGMLDCLLWGCEKHSQQCMSLLKGTHTVLDGCYAGTGRKKSFHVFTVECTSRKWAHINLWNVSCQLCTACVCFAHQLSSEDASWQCYAQVSRNILIDPSDLTMSLQRTGF